MQILFFKYLLAQEVPSDFFEYSLKKIHSDSGKDWENNTSISSIRFQDIHNSIYNKDSLPLPI